MISISRKEDCCGCYACYNACPKQCIDMIDDEEGFVYPRVNKNLCIDCNICIKSCPMINGIKKDLFDKKAFAGYNKDLNTRLKSSSGGFFSIIASQVLQQGGIVFGASFDERFNVKHIKINTLNDLYKLRGSKYIQSDINSVYSDVKYFLEQDKRVLFSGSPCQVEGLFSFLQKKYDNLITQDFVCHGVPSKQIWNTYLKRFGIINSVFFRDKTNGWENYSIKIDEYLIPAKDSSYMKAFIAGYSLRPSCYECRFKKRNRISDITLGDLWGSKEIVPELDDHFGLSLVVINTEKAEKLLEKLSSQFVFKNIDFENAIQYNSSYIMSVQRPNDRDAFFEEVNSNNFDDIVFKKYCKRKLLSSIRERFKKIIKK